MNDPTEGNYMPRSVLFSQIMEDELKLEHTGLRRGEKRWNVQQLKCGQKEANVKIIVL